MKALVLMEHDGTALRPGSSSAIGFARELSEDVTVLLLGESLGAMATEAAKHAPVLTADHEALASPVADRWAHVITEVARAQNIELIVATSTTWAKDIVGRAAGLLGGTMASDVIGHEIIDGELRLRRPMFAGRLVLFGVFQLAQQMHQTRLPRSAYDRIVRSPKIGNQRPRKLLDKKLCQGRTAARSIDHVERQKLVGKAPQPVGFAIGSPACFVAVKYRRLQGFFSNLLVPSKEDFLQSIPHLHQAAFADLQLQMKVEDLDDLRQRIAQGVVQPSRKHQHAETQCGGPQKLDRKIS